MAIDRKLREYRPPRNPQIEELRIRYQGRRMMALSLITRVVKFGVVHCKWCLDRIGPKSQRHYCSNACQDSAWMYFYPQQHSIGMLLKKQNGRCNHCQHEWKSGDEYYQEYAEGMGMEVDHIKPIYKGGMSLGVDNIQLLCKKCHLKKTSDDRKN